MENFVRSECYYKWRNEVYFCHVIRQVGDKVTIRPAVSTANIGSGCGGERTFTTRFFKSRILTIKTAPLN